MELGGGEEAARTTQAEAVAIENGETIAQPTPSQSMMMTIQDEMVEERSRRLIGESLDARRAQVLAASR